MSKPWTIEEISFLEDSWGTKTIQSIAKHLNRSTISVERKANRLQLGPWLESGDYITLNQLWKTLGLGNGNEYRKISWIEKRNFPVKYKKSVKRNTQIVYIKDFWIWAECNQDMLDLSKLEPLSLGEEPKWVENKRLQDRMKNIRVQESNWTKYDDNRLLDMLKSYRYTTKQIANTLHRTEQAVIQRINSLDIKYRPLPEDKHNTWTDDELQLLIELLRTCSHYTLISNKIQSHSEKAIKSKVYNLFGTQNLTRVRKLL